MYNIFKDVSVGFVPMTENLMGRNSHKIQGVVVFTDVQS